MKAKIKRIKLGTILDADGYKDSFENGMLRMARSGKVFEFSEYPFCPNWYICTKEGSEYNFHVSWLKNIKK